MKLTPNIFLFLCLHIVCVTFGQTNGNRDNTTVTDSLLKKHRKQTPILFSIKNDMAVSSLFFYKKGKCWNGVLLNDAKLVNQSSQFVHVITVRNFEADTVGQRLIKLGIAELKQYTIKDLSIFYNEQRKLTGNKNVEYELPYCIDGATISISFKGKSYSYGDCITSDPILKKLPEIDRFHQITNYLQVMVYPLLNKRKK